MFKITQPFIQMGRDAALTASTFSAFDTAETRKAPLLSLR